MRPSTTKPPPDLSVQVGSLKMANPVTTGSGTFGQGDLFECFFDINRLGALTTKSVTLEPRRGNPPPRIAETPSGYLNAIGLQNPGVTEFVKQYQAFFETLQTPLIISIAGVTVAEYAQVAAQLQAALPVAAFEINISCPNVQAEGLQFACSPDAAASVVAAVRAETSAALITKLTPNTDNNVAVGQACLAAGSDGLAAINTLKAMAIDVQTRRPKLGNITGGLSGPAIKPVALRWVYELFEATQAPIIAMGGIQNTTDALEFIIAGASAVAVGTANFYKPQAPMEVISGLSEWLTDNHEPNLSGLRGSLKTDPDSI